MNLKGIWEGVKSGISAAGTFVNGKKRYIGWGLALIAQVVPSHTVVGQSAGWLNDNLGNVSIGLDVLSGLFIGAAGVKSYKEYKAGKLPSGIGGEQ